MTIKLTLARRQDFNVGIESKIGAQQLCFLFPPTHITTASSTTRYAIDHTNEDEAKVLPSRATIITLSSDRR